MHSVFRTGTGTGGWTAAGIAAGVVMMLFITSGCSQPPAVVVHDAVLRAPLPGSDKTVGYFRVQNNGAQPLVLVGAESVVSRAIEIHETRQVDGMMRMRRLAEVVVPAGGEVAFASGGRHLMLFGVNELPATALVTLHDNAGGSYPVTFDVVDVTQAR